MAVYPGEEEIWKCPQHSSKRRRTTGVCSLCLKERLAALCPDCANVRPCSCCPTTSSSSSASSSFSVHISELGRSSTLANGDSVFRRSRSSAFPFFRSARFSSSDDKKPSEKTAGNSSTSSLFWALLWWRRKPKREKVEVDMRRSRSVSVAGNDIKGKRWYFPSPMKVFRQSTSKASKFVHERSPLQRG